MKYRVTPPPSAEGPFMRVTRYIAGGLTDGWCWLTGRNNYSLARVMLGLGVPLHMASLWPYSIADGILLTFVCVLIGLVFLASFRRQVDAVRAIAKGFRPRLWATRVDCIFIWGTVVFMVADSSKLNITMARWGNLCFFMSYFVFDHHNAGGKSAPARAFDAVKAMLDKVSLPVLRPALQPAVVRP